MKDILIVDIAMVMIMGIVMGIIIWLKNMDMTIMIMDMTIMIMDMIIMTMIIINIMIIVIAVIKINPNSNK
jgi:hypothetical protein